MTKQIKTLIALGVMLLLSFSLVACGGPTNPNTPPSYQTKNSNKQVTITVTVADKSTDYQVTKGTSLLDFAVAKLHAKETKGFINSVGDIKEDKATSTYIMFKVDGQDSPVGADAVKLTAGKKIDFYLEKY